MKQMRVTSLNSLTKTSMLARRLLPLCASAMSQA